METSKLASSDQSHLILAGLWLVLGLYDQAKRLRLLNIGSWDNFLGPRQIDLNKINGHFAAIKYSNDELKFFTDELGLREIYIVQLPDGFGFTTRIDWLKYFINPETGFEGIWLEMASSKSNIQKEYYKKCNSARLC